VERLTPFFMERSIGIDDIHALTDKQFLDFCKNNIKGNLKGFYKLLLKNEAIRRDIYYEFMEKCVL